MNETVDIKIVNNRFKLLKIRKDNVASNLTRKKGVPFVGVGTEVGEIKGETHKLGQTISTSEDFTIKPLIVFCESGAQANAMFENLKKDRTRFNKLAGEIQKQSIMNKAKLTQMLNETKEVDNSNRMSQVMEKAKRLALNNGVFKPNDSY
ncbi:MAG: hypothetical protein J6B98_01915 [Bacilli bacterium]|nr:hypothetical protein [Bacilli bacterium]